MKTFIRILLAAIFIYIGLSFLLPHNAYPIEHFEQFLSTFLPFNWKFLAVFSRVLVGLFFIIAFLLLFYWEKIKWMKYVSILMLSIPFIINPVFPDSFKDVSPEYYEDIAFNVENPNIETVLVYVSPNCLHCKEALIKLDRAKKNSANFSNVRVISYNYKIQNYMDEKELNLPLDSISPELFLKITKGSFPKFQFVKNSKILKKWSSSEFNYAVLDNLSN